MNVSNELPFLFIHGAGGSKTKWRTIHEHLTDIPYRCLDLPGHGENSEQNFNSIKDYADAISKQINQDIIVVGHSMGGLIGIELASQNKRIKGLILVSSHYQMPVDSTILQALSENSFPESLFYVSYNKRFDMKLLEEERAELQETPMEIMYSDYASCSQYTNGQKAFSALKIPILAIYGVEDRLLPDGVRETILKENQNVKIVDIDECRHYAMLEKPKPFTNTIIDFRENILKSQFEQVKEY